jgi:hypothetical protein
LCEGVGNTLTSDVEVRLQDDEEEHEQQEVDDGVDGKLVFMFMRSTGRCRPGICSTPPGHRSANSAVAMIDGAQSLIAPAVQARPPPLLCSTGKQQPSTGEGEANQWKAKAGRWYRLRTESMASGTEHTTDGKHGIGHRAPGGRASGR